MNRVLILISCAVGFNSFAQSNRYDGVNNDPSFDSDFAKGSDKIILSIKENLNHLNLYEYAHALPELYQLISSNQIRIEDWKGYVDSLEYQVKTHQNDTLRPYWAVDHLGLIPLQAQFFLASLEKTQKLKKQYPEAYLMIKENTSFMNGLGYRPEDYDSLIRPSRTDAVRGVNTIWYFLQLEDCGLLEKVSANSKAFIKLRADTGEMTATYKVPYYLQKRKWQSIQRRLRESGNELCQDIAESMDTRSIEISDDDREYFSRALKDGIDRNKTKEF